jgi:hypothetical protein
MTSAEELIARVDERQKAMMAKLNEIHTEVKKTNGRVTDLEKWKSGIIGSYRATVIISAAIGAAITIVTDLIL